MKMSTLKMHKPILVWVGVFIAFVATLPIAMSRVSQNEKFAGQHVKSLTCEGQKPEVEGVISWIETCSQMKVEPISPAKK